MEIRTEVQRFAELMEEKLQRREAKYPDGWKNDEASALFKHLKEEVNELSNALYLGKNSQAAQEAVDVANMAMMIVDVLNNGR